MGKLKLDKNNKSICLPNINSGFLKSPYHMLRQQISAKIIQTINLPSYMQALKSKPSRAIEVKYDDWHEKL